MLNKLLRVLAVLTFTFVTSILIYTSYNIMFMDVVYEKNYFIGCATYYLALLLIYLVDRSKTIHINESLLLIVLMFDFCASVLGELCDFYTRFTWWDNLLHSFSGFVISFVILCIIASFLGDEKLVSIPKEFIILFIFTATISMGVFWEIFEFLMDTFFNYNMQKTFIVDQYTDFSIYIDQFNRFIAPSLVDTMIDLMEDVLSALVGCVVIFHKTPIGMWNILNKKSSE